MTAEEARNVAVMRQFLQDTSSGNVEAIVDAYADDGAVTTMGRTLISGRFDKAAVTMAAGRIFEAFPDGIRFTIHTMTAQDDRVAIEASSEGAHVSGHRYTNDYHFLARLRDGKIVEFKEYCDTERITDILCGGQRPQA